MKMIQAGRGSARRLANRVGCGFMGNKNPARRKASRVENSSCSELDGFLLFARYMQSLDLEPGHTTTARCIGNDRGGARVGANDVGPGGAHERAENAPGHDSGQARYSVFLSEK